VIKTAGSDIRSYAHEYNNGIKFIFQFSEPPDRKIVQNFYETILQNDALFSRTPFDPARYCGGKVPTSGGCVLNAVHIEGVF
jgi:hypothetical protein